MKRIISILMSIMMISSVYIGVFAEGEEVSMSVDVIPVETEVSTEDATIEENVNSDIELYDLSTPVTDSWSTASSLVTGKAQFHTLSINGDIHIVGGNDNNGYSNTIEKYNETTASWESVTTIPTETYGFTAVAADTKIYVIGGYLNNVYMNDVQIYDTVTNEWTTAAPMLERREEAASLYTDNKVYIFGGRNANGIVNSYEYYDIPNNTWNKVTSGYDETLIRIGAKAKYVNGYVCIYGGYNNACENMGVNLYLATDMSIMNEMYGKGKAHISIAWGTNKGLMFLTDARSSTYAIYELFVEDENPYTEQITDITAPTTMYYSEAAIYDGYLYFMGGYNAASKTYNSSVHKYSVYYGEYSTGDGQIVSDVTADGNTVTLNVDAGKEYMFMVNVNNVSTFDGYTFNLEYTEDSFIVKDGCALTSDEDNIGYVEGTDITIMEINGAGISFISTETLQGEVSKSINAIILKATSSGQRTITYSMTQSGEGI